MNDDDIRAVLASLRRVPIPPAPKPHSQSPFRAWSSLGAAALLIAALILLVVSETKPPVEKQPIAPVEEPRLERSLSDQLQSTEDRIARFDHDELRRLLLEELRLYRRELELLQTPR